MPLSVMVETYLAFGRSKFLLVAKRPGIPDLLSPVSRYGTSFAGMIVFLIRVMPGLIRHIQVRVDL